MTPVTTKNFYNHLSNYTNNECFCFEDIDECLLEVCSEDAECTNTDGSFSCRCKRGYQGNGFNCSGLCSLLFPVTLKKKKLRHARLVFLGDSHIKDRDRMVERYPGLVWWATLDIFSLLCGTKSKKKSHLLTLSTFNSDTDNCFE